MKKIISRKVYNTETAENLGSTQYSWPGDFSYWYEGLYRNKKGEFFLHVEGGPASKYSISTGSNSSSGDERIIPLSYSKAQDWAERYLSGDDYEKIFGPVKEDDTKKLLSLMVSTEAVDKLARYADKTGRAKAEILDDLLLTLS